MPDKQKITLKEKETKLIEKIKKAKKDLSRLQGKRHSEIGKLACQHGLDTYDDTILNQSFARLSKELKELADGNP